MKRTSLIRNIRNFRDLSVAACLIVVAIAIAAHLLVGCSSNRLLTGSHSQNSREATRDTIYLSDVRYDSIYIDNWHSLERHADTVYRERSRTEYRYRLLRDTIRIVRHDSILVIQRDSIPYEVTIKEVKEIARPLSWFDHLTRITFWLLVGSLLMWLLRNRNP